MSSVVRIGSVSKVNYEDGTIEVTYEDRADSVTDEICMVSNAMYRMPVVGKLVCVLHNSDSQEMGTCIGTIWNEDNKPVEGKKGRYRHDYNDEQGKAFEQYTGPGLKSYQFEIQLVSKLGVNPRKIFDALMKHCEAGTIDYFILNNKPMSQNPFKLTKVTTGWGAVHRFWGLKDGKVTLTLEEYAP